MTMAKSDPDLEKLRHSLSHLLAAAVLELYPDAKPALGPAIENGFYYDFEFGKPISENDLAKIEERMKEILKDWDDFSVKGLSAEEAKEIYKNNPYKLELISEIEKKGEEITLYVSGGFEDLCRGGHAESAKDIDPEGFKLSRLAGAYWRGNEKNKMLTRIYGLAFENKKELEDCLRRQEEAKERDHRKLGKELDLFTFSDLVGPGLPLFTPKGTLMRNLITEKIFQIQEKYDYQSVWIPHITKKELYETSGHWEKFGEELFHVKGAGETHFVMKPMNCPHHTQIYASKPRSYRELPVRFAEATTVYRDEQAGELLGIVRVRSLTQDDGHVFCTPDQIEKECEIIVDVIKEFYESLGMWKNGEYWVSLSVRDPETPEKYIGQKEIWDKSEKTLEDIARKNNLEYKKIQGEAAFYGPKLDFMFKDAIGREWQLATIQLDFNMPKRFGLEYTSKDGTKETPVMIHRAVAGSLERFMGVMIEHFAGAFPLWLSPVQAKILPIGEDHREYAGEILAVLKKRGFRVEMDSSDETLGKRIRQVKLEKIPYFAVIGDNEMSSKEIKVESRDKGDLGLMSAEDFADKLDEEIESKR